MVAATDTAPPPQADLPSAPPAAAGAACPASELPLPACIVRRTEGLLVNVAEASIDQQFARFVDRVFAAGALFVDLDYTHFSHLLYGDTNAGAKSPPLRIAQALADFPAERRALYKAVKLAEDDESAEYLFEQLTAEVGDGQGGEPETEPAHLSFDEFVAHLWRNGVRFGIAEKPVRQAIEKREATRLEVARARKPQDGKDAHLIEESDALHRDNSPKTLANGHIDLGQFRNRYPQVAKGAALLRKAARTLGKPGFMVSGEPILPPIPEDFDLAQLAGPGTKIEQRANGETIVATMNGFLNLDTHSNLISITEKIVSHDGVSLRTTGNLSLRGEDYEEYGEVQEKRVVEGNNMTFHADVFGTLSSHGGTIHLHQNLSGGKAISPSGKIIIDGRTSASVIEAPDGEVRIKHAEGCTIFAARVHIERAVLCQIIGDSVEIAHSEGSAIGGRAVDIGQASARKDVESIISMFTPDFTEMDAQRAELTKKSEETVTQLEQHHKQIETIQHQPELANFLALQGKIKRGEIKLTASQAESLKRAAAQFAPLLQQLKQLSDAHRGLQAVLADLTRQQGQLDQQRQAAGDGIHCRLENVDGDTIVRTSMLNAVHSLEGDALHAKMTALRSAGEPKDRLFADAKGHFAWQYGSGEGKDEGWVA